ncbi:MAG: T9SS type B sorting domain-containing protein [Paludibacteraceae bacterium]|nr:T9SS type B sorting domain-containing protein [Paludibacteraceae bacterium]
MTKRAISLLFLSVLFFFASTAWSATVNLTSTIKFEPKEDVTETYFTIDETATSSPFITSITTKYAFSASNVSGQKGEYHIKDGVAEFGYYSPNNSNYTDGLDLNLLTFTFDNLVIGKTYTFTLKGKFSGNDIQLKRGFSGFANVDNAGPQWPQFNNSITTNTWTFTANSTQGSATFSYNPSYANKGLQTFTFTEASLAGPCEEMVSSSLGYEVCAGDITTLSAIGQNVTAPVVWESSEDGITWTTIPNETAIDIQVLVTDRMFYRAKKGTKILYTPLVPGSTTQHQAITPVICCAKAGDLTPIFTESFDLIDDDIIQLMGSSRGKFKNNDITTYSYASGTFPARSYAILKTPSQGGHWTSSHIEGGNTQRPVSQGGMGQNPAKDGFYLVDCGAETGVIFTYTVEDNALCSNTVYDFSAFICNVDNTTGHAPVNATLSVVGKKAGQPDYEFFKIPTGDLGSGSDWWQYGRSFNSGDYTTFVVSIRNNYQGTVDQDGNVLGNDIGVDDIVFSACRPEIQIYSDNAYKPIVTVCGQGSNVNVLLEASAVYDLTEFFDTPYYFFQTSTSETGPWSPVSAAASTDPSITIDVDPTQYQNGLYYRVWVGATKEAVEASATSGQPGTGCRALTAVSDPIKITYECECTASPAPEAENYKECPSTTKLDLNTLITNPSSTGTYYWYTSATGDTPMSATDAQNVDVSTYNSASPTTTYYVTYDQDGTSDTYCESERTAVTVTLKPQSAGINTTGLVPDDYCRNDLATTTMAGYMTSTADPQTVWTWHKVDAAGNVLRPLNDLSGNNTNVGSSEFKFVVMQDDTSPFYIRVSSESPNYCAKSDVFLHGYIHENTNFTLSAPDEVCAAAPEVTLTLTNMEGTGDLVIKKGSTVLKTEPNFSGTEYTFTDNTAHGNVASVTYTITFGNATMCGKEVLHTVLIGTNMNVPLTSNATNNTVCEGTKVTITSSRPENASEYYTWYKTGADGVRTKVAEGNGMRVYSDLEALTAKTIYDVEVTNGACEGDGTITINVDKKPIPTLSVDPAIICLEGTATVTYAEAATLTSPSYVWKDNGTILTGEDDASLTYTGETEGTHTITLEVTNGTCFADATTQVDVLGAIDFSVSATPNILCQGEGTTLAFDINTTQYPDATYSWTLNGTAIPQEDPKATSLAITADAAGEFTYIGTVKDVCQASKEVTITVEKGIVASIQDYEICEGNDVKLELDADGDYTYKWSPNNGLSDNTIQQPTASPKQDITYTVEIETLLKTCSATKETKVTVHPKPVIVSIEETDVRQITAVADDQTQWPTFRVDDIDNTYENSPVVISGIPIGYHRLYITNEWGCENSDTFEISPIPVIPKKFFSPNGEGDPETERWTVEGLDAYTSWIVEIFDRYGRRLYEYRTGSFSETANDPTTWLGWDGNYNGHQMPSDDYWYLITVEEIRKQYTGHFTLKR